MEAVSNATNNNDDDYEDNNNNKMKVLTLYWRSQIARRWSSLSLYSLEYKIVDILANSLHWKFRSRNAIAANQTKAIRIFCLRFGVVNSFKRLSGVTDN